MTEPDSGSDQPRLADPPKSLWTELGMIPEAEVHGGFQSKVFLARVRSGRLIVKLIEARTARDDAVLRDRVELTRRVAEINPAVVGPVMLSTDPVIRIDRWHVVCYPYIEGSHPDASERSDVEMMATTLAALHDSLATLTGPDLPPVAALGDTAQGSPGRGQLIHGDYAPANLIVTSSGLKVIDFDECGQGSVEFEIGNTLYMARFDAWHSGALDRYDHFRSWFVDAYRSAAPFDIEDALLDEAIRVRARALERWLARPMEAPVGIRTSSPEWQQRLRSFVAQVLP